ncbi:MAG: hypothetical protein HYT80_06040 [Euryarchaeota archaeon]|nr:hypothetical protein [Euryarchaeota archaeon]
MRALAALAVVVLFAGCFESEPTIRLKDRPATAPGVPGPVDEGLLGRWLRVGTWEIPVAAFDTPWAIKLRLHVEGSDRCRLNLTTLTPVAHEPNGVAKLWALRSGSLAGYGFYGPYQFVRVGPTTQLASQSSSAGFGGSFSITPKTDWVSFGVLAKPETKGPFRLALDCNHLPLTPPQWWASRQVLALTDADAYAAANWGDGAVTLRGEGSRSFDGDVGSYFASKSELGEIRITHPGGTRTWPLDQSMAVQGFSGPAGVYRIEFTRAGLRPGLYFFWSLTVGWQDVEAPTGLLMLPT